MVRAKAENLALVRITVANADGSTVFDSVGPMPKPVAKKVIEFAATLLTEHMLKREKKAPVAKPERQAKGGG